MRRWFSAALRRVAGEFVECESGWELLLQLSQEPACDLVVASKSLPGPSPSRLLGMLRAADVQVPFVLVAPFSDNGLRALVGRVPGAALVDDTLDSVRLADAAETLLASRPREPSADQVRRAVTLCAGNRGGRVRVALGLINIAD